MLDRERKALEHFAGGPAPAPKGVGGGTLYNLIYKELIMRTESAQDLRPPFYAITDKGRKALFALVK